MGKANNGILGAVSGKVGNLIFYVLNGMPCVRTVGTRTAALTEGERLNTSKMAVLMNLFKYMKPFLKLGFSTHLSHGHHNYHNAATSYNRKNAVFVINGRAEIAFEHLRLTSGNAMEAQRPAVELIGNNLEFNWSYDEIESWSAGSDQVMLMAWFPDDSFAIYETAGAKRRSLTETLQIPQSYLEKRMELYISFISNDRQSVAKSIYLGRLN
jgi:hypothetical protein